ncbi:MAG: cytochrome P460 family protein [Bacteroidetes bacterium]|nr:cytochrome P460 family protein [Bacteroidota bacterium]MBK7431690.1 cytochrome P460 family protein [Bacteroidota bacterium]MBK7570784.1 cytochrome P460 family protein [Bacteroidota bacterium]
MKKTRVIALAAFSITLLASVQSCKKDIDNEPVPQEFVADNSTFANFMAWSLDATAQGPDPALGGMAHGGNDSTVVRNVYFKNGQDPVNGTYPIGTVIVKHSANTGGTVNEHTAMVKRGNSFNSNVGNWEFFVLMPDGSIAADSAGTPMRGANLMNGMCGGCHSAVSSKDFVFSK